MRRMTMAGLVLLLATTMAGAAACSRATPMERANELIEEYVSLFGEAAEALKAEVAYGEEQYAEAEGIPECRDEKRRTWTGAQARQYDLRSYHELEIATAVIRAAGACNQAQSDMWRRRQDLDLGGMTTEEVVQGMLDRLRVSVGRLDQTVLEIILDNAESKEAAWASLMNGMGQDGLAEWPTEERVQAELKETRERIDEAVATAHRTREEFLREQAALDAVYAAIAAGTWEGRSALSE